jgi:hypothetical protein
VCAFCIWVEIKTHSVEGLLALFHGPDSTELGMYLQPEEKAKIYFLQVDTESQAVS